MKPDSKRFKPGKLYFLERGIFVRKTRAGELRYGISVEHRGHQYRRIKASTLAGARHALTIARSEILQDRFKIADKKVYLSFAELAELYLEHAKKAKRSWKRDEGALKIAGTFFNKKRINEITTWDLKRYQAQRAEERSKATVNRDIALLKYMFRLAVDWGFLKSNPATKIRLYREEEKAIRVLTAQEEARLYDAAAPHLKPIITLALNTGLRRMELLSLQWDSVDLPNRVLTVGHSKSGRIRRVPLNATCIKTLKSLPLPRQGHVFRYKGAQVQSVHKAFQAAVRRSGIRACRFHDLRHTFATRLVLAGKDLATVKQLLGHGSITTTMKYAHPSPKHLRDAVNSLSPTVTKP